MTKNPFKPADGGETNEAKTATTGATAKRPRKQDMSPEEWARHLSQVRREAAAKAVRVLKENAKGRKAMSSISVRSEDGQEMRRIAEAQGVSMAELFSRMLTKYKA